MRAIDTDHDGKVTAQELKHAQETPWMAEALSHLVVRCESEWGGGLGKWEALSPLMKKLLWLWKTEIERIGKLQWWEQVASVEGFPKQPSPWHFHPIGLVGNFNSYVGPITLEEARVRAFLRMIRIGEGTQGSDGLVAYERLFGGQSFITDYGKDFSDHPHIMVTRNIRGRSVTSSAAGAYQVMGCNWDGGDSKEYKRRAHITDFCPISQDRYSVALLLFKRHALDAVKRGDMKAAIFTYNCNLEWASLPGDKYDQGGVTMKEVQDNFQKFVDEELQGKTDLAVPYGGLGDLIK